MAEATEGEVIGTEAREGQGSPYILMLTHKSLANCFRLDFSTGLGREWSNLGLKGLLSKPHKSPVSQYPLMFHYKLKSLKTIDGKRFSTHCFHGFQFVVKHEEVLGYQGPVGLGKEAFQA